MSAKEFIYNSLKEFVVKFSKTRIRYEYDECAAVHIIEVLPNEIYHLDNDYIEWEDKFYNDFIALFPTESVCFISDDALVGVSIPELVLEGTEYGPITSENTFTVSFSTKIKQNTNCYYEITFLNEKEINNHIESETLPFSMFDNSILNAA